MDQLPSNEQVEKNRLKGIHQLRFHLGGTTVYQNAKLCEQARRGVMSVQTP